MSCSQEAAAWTSRLIQTGDLQHGAKTLCLQMQLHMHTGSQWAEQRCICEAQRTGPAAFPPAAPPPQRPGAQWKHCFQNCTPKSSNALCLTSSENPTEHKTLQTSARFQLSWTRNNTSVSDVAYHCSIPCEAFENIMITGRQCAALRLPGRTVWLRGKRAADVTVVGVISVPNTEPGACCVIGSASTCACAWVIMCPIWTSSVFFLFSFYFLADILKLRRGEGRRPGGRGL